MLKFMVLVAAFWIATSVVMGKLHDNGPAIGQWLTAHWLVVGLCVAALWLVYRYGIERGRAVARVRVRTAENRAYLARQWRDGI